MSTTGKGSSRGHDARRILSTLAELYAAPKSPKDLPSLGDLLEDDVSAFEYLVELQFFRGRRNKLSKQYFECIKRAIEETGKKYGGRTMSVIKDQEDEIVALYRQYVSEMRYKVNKNDERLIRGLVEVVRQIPEAQGRRNVVAWATRSIENGETWKLYYTLRGISEAGPKIVSLFIRDMVRLLGLESGLSPQDYGFVVPIDIWVERAVKILWPDVYKPADKEYLKWKLICECLASDVSPIAVEKTLASIGQDCKSAKEFEAKLINLGRGQPSS